jgi:hypothetical protein
MAEMREVVRAQEAEMEQKLTPEEMEREVDQMVHQMVLRMEKEFLEKEKRTQELFRTKTK